MRKAQILFRPYPSSIIAGLTALLLVWLSACTNQTEDPEASTTHPSTPPAAASASPTPTPTPTPTPEPIELPRGGREIFPTYRLFGYSGHPGAPGQGRLGIGDLRERVVEMEERGQPFLDGREIMPVMELIVTTVHPVPGQDGMYRTRLDAAKIQEWLDVAREHDAMLLLNIQPGRADFIDEVQAYEQFLTQPDVGLALDPEWAVDEGQIPGRVYGSTDAAELNEVGQWVSDLIAEHDLPEKAVIYHQLHPRIVADEQDIRTFPGVVWVKSVDGIGSPAAKTDTWLRLTGDLPEGVHPGFKLFYEEDAEHGPLMTPEQVMALTPEVEYVLYE